MQDYSQSDDFKLPKLKGTLTLSDYENSHDGSPRWMLHDAVLNEYFQLEWLEFECVSRLHYAQTAQGLVDMVNAQTPLRIDLEDIKSLILFLSENSLLALSSGEAQNPEIKEKSLFSKILHGYLFFTVPLFKPQLFLDKTYPYIRPLLSRGFIVLMLGLFIVGVYLTAARFDEFFHTFMQILTPTGILLSAAVLIFVKIIHEFGHAYAATKYKIPVPHMGIAFIIMYPILYTETSASWQIKDRKGRLAIGLSGVLAELYLGAVFLILWNITVDPTLQALCVSVVVISLLGSLFVNLNPLMRFDGYYVISDAMRIENLQNRAFDAARWIIRRVFFNTPESHPDAFAPEGTKRFLNGFGLSVLIYRFFLFLGIALLVYHLFFKPLGLFLMIIELWWFIGLPILSELKRWWECRDIIFRERRAKITGLCAVILVLVFFLPISHSVSAPSLLLPQNLKSLYPPENAVLKRLSVSAAQRVEEGDVLAVLESDKLIFEHDQVRAEISRLQHLRAKQKFLPENLKRNTDLNAEIDAAKSKLNEISAKIENLTIVAPFSGEIVDFNLALYEGLSVSKADLLFRIKNNETYQILAFVPEYAVDRIELGSVGKFYSDANPHQATSFHVIDIAKTNSQTLNWLELSSVYGGGVPSAQDNSERYSKPIFRAINSTYAIRLQPNEAIGDDITMVLRGHSRISAETQIPLIQFLGHTAGLLLREINFN